MNYLRLDITFLQGTYHGMIDGGKEEWPPSPMRVFQALVATAGRKYGDDLPDSVGDALDWLGGLAPPMIHAPQGIRAKPIRTSVPNNAMDICARAWCRGTYDAKDAKPSTHKAMKTIAPVRLLGDDPVGHRVTYYWALTDQGEDVVHGEAIAMLARQLACVGWGLDLVAGHAEITDESSLANDSDVSADQWTPERGCSTRLRVAGEVTRKALDSRHQQFLKRLDGGGMPRFSVPGVMKGWVRE